uniref:non-specific serine/threonine protein kinase n=1 Tax=Albugo laibachii Nc14 TaxID=890382 RepID=F0VZV7_9STRA|nr:phosphoinositide 3kinase regulatory subunit putativ [Albugo laibachii Nc14]|eukprot:CCA14328.1 phosphoinositide 3kinase regulatory subunit putativ [Albugo laibachii Nc14]
MGNASARDHSFSSAVDSFSQYRTYLMDYSLHFIKIIFGSVIGNNKFLKTIYGKMEENDLGTVPIVMKIYKKSHAHEPLEDTRLYLRKLQRLFRSVHRYPNVIMYQDFQVSARYPVAYLVRPFVANNLYDRIHSRPFLTMTEKLWIAFQLLKALEQIHSLGVCHGDIKLENCMITTWNWILLTDFAPFKPTFIPENDPTEYHYYFCAIDNSRRSCTLAPERFYTTESYKDNKMAKKLVVREADDGVGRIDHSASHNRIGGQHPIRNLTNAEGGNRDKRIMEAWMLSHLANSKITLEEADQQLSNTKYSTTAETVGEGNTFGNNFSKQDRKLQKDETYMATMNSVRSRIESLSSTMDIFSAGCVIAEVFLGGKPLFDLPSLLKYRLSGDVSPIAARLNKIRNPELEDLILHMIQLNPQARWTATRYMERFKNTAFPSYFESFLFSFFSQTLSHAKRSSDTRISILSKCYGQIVKESTGLDDKEGENFFLWRLRHHDDYEDSSSFTEESEIKAKSDLRKLSRPHSPELGQTEVKDWTADAGEQSYTKLYQQYILELENASFRGLTGGEKIISKEEDPAEKSECTSTRHGSISSVKPFRNENEANGIMITLSMITSCLRHLRHPHSKLTAMYLIHALSRFVTDEIRLQRLVPFLLESITDTNALVRAQAIRSTTFILDLITAVPLADASVFTQYIFPTMSPVISDSEIFVQVAFAECLPCLASTARRFVDSTEILRLEVCQNSRATNPPVKSSSDAPSDTQTPNKPKALYSHQHEKLLQQLHQLVSEILVQLSQSERANSHFVKRALLLDLTRLSVFFGRNKTVDFLLPQLIPFMNDRNRELRQTVFDELIGICVFVGKRTVESFILPCLQQALHDTDEQVIVSALQLLRSLLQLGLFHRDYSGIKNHLFSTCSASMSTESLVDKATSVLPLVGHSSWWVRDTVFQLMASIVMQLGIIDTEIFLVPLLRPYLRKPLMLSQVPFSTTPFKSRAQADAAESIVVTILRGSCRSVVGREMFHGGTESLIQGNTDSAKQTEAKFTDEDTSMSDHITNQNLTLMQPRTGRAGSNPTGIGSHTQRHPERREAADTVKRTTPIRLRMDTGIPKIGKLSSARRKLYAIQVPDMRFALVAGTLDNVMNDTASFRQSNTSAIIGTGSHKKNVVSMPSSRSASPKYSPSNEDIVRQYGINVPEFSASTTSKSLFKNDKRNTTTSHAANSTSSWTYFDGKRNEITGFSPNESFHEYPALDTNVSTIDSSVLIVGDSNQSNYGSNSHRLKLANASPSYDAKEQDHRNQSNLDVGTLEPCRLLSRLKALEIPCLPPDFGALQAPNDSEKHYSIYADHNSALNIFHPNQLNLNMKDKCLYILDGIGANGSEGVLSMIDCDAEMADTRVQAASIIQPASMFALDASKSTAERHPWRPRKNALVAEFSEHSDPVIRIGAAQDSSFLASASRDGTVKLWSLNSLYDKKKHKSRGSFSIHNGILTDMIVLDNSHSVICSSLTGNLQVFRVERATEKQYTSGQKDSSSFHFTGLSDIRAQADPIMVLDYFNTITQALVIYATWSGNIHGWDLRVHRRSWTIQAPLQLGHITCMTHSPGLMWLAAATSRGFLCLWDLRFQVLLRVWRHSSQRTIHRILACPRRTRARLKGEALAYVSTEDGYVSLFDLNSGSCHAIYRSMTSERVEGLEAMRSSVLHHLPLTKNGGILGTNGLKIAVKGIESASRLHQGSIVRSIVSPMMHYADTQEAIITGGDDGRIRYWDLEHPEAGFTVCGEGDCSSFYEASKAMKNSKQLSTSTERFVNPEKLSQPSRKTSSPSVTTCWEKKNATAMQLDQQINELCIQSSKYILDMTIVNFHGPLVASSSRAGVVKIWR